MEGEGSPAATKDAPVSRQRLSVPVSLPDELVVEDILRRLPAKLVIRSGAVCRFWRTGTTTPEFRTSFHEGKPSLPLIEFRFEPSMRFYADALETLDVLDRRRVLTFDRCRIRLHASCDGLLLLSYTDNGRYVICNPATQECIPLSGLTGGEFAGLYSAGAEYRVLFWKGMPGNAQYFLLTVGSSAPPRPVVLSGAPQDFARRGIWTQFRPAAFFQDALHWVPGSSKDTLDKVLVFDTIQESFRSMRSPVAIAAETAKTKPSAARIFVMEGTLCISTLQHGDEGEAVSTVTTWALQDYHREIWEEKNHVTLAAECTDHLVLSNKGDLLLYFGSPVRRLIRSDSEGNMLNEVAMESSSAHITGQWFKEHLLEHNFFQGRKKKKPQPPFFEGI